MTEHLVQRARCRRWKLGAICTHDRYFDALGRRRIPHWSFDWLPEECQHLDMGEGYQSPSGPKALLEFPFRPEAVLINLGHLRNGRAELLRQVVADFFPIFVGHQ